MSADLFAEFGSAPSRPATASRKPPVSHPHSDPPQDGIDDADEWGEFEEFQISKPAPLPAAQTQSPNPFLQAPARPSIVAQSSFDLTGDSSIQNVAAGSAASSFHNVQSVPEPTPPQAKAGRKKREPSNPNIEVLFDADDTPSEEEVIEDDDEFGDYETVPYPDPPPKPLITSPDPIRGFVPIAPPTPQEIDLLGLHIPNTLSNPYPEAPKSPSFRERNPFADLSVATTPVTPGSTSPLPARNTTKAAEKEDKKDDDIASPMTAWPTFQSTNKKQEQYLDSPLGLNTKPPAPSSTANKKEPTIADDEFDNWDTFDAPPVLPAFSKPAAAPPTSTEWRTAALPTKTSMPLHLPPTVGFPSSTNARPSNIPPPSLLLPLFTPLLSSIPPQPHTTTLPPHLSHITTLARLLAGRHLRHKRSPTLAASLAISDVSSGVKHTGLKLTRLSNAETKKEDREVGEVLDAWAKNVGRLRGAVGGLNKGLVADGLPRGRGMLQVPVIERGMEKRVRVASVAQGGVKDELAGGRARECVVCGLKREERVVGVDGDGNGGWEVEDSFGEWWMEGYGHQACRRFWGEFEGELRGR